ncbi:DUF6353 family protein [Bacteroides sp.]|uniref:DUF6353 family protein n=1 Tax=Bacteroides sp. TaxID=29523 RepID=UPI002584EF0B|nr:DUF6353 family protein [Bacteroides sp.]
MKNNWLSKVSKSAAKFAGKAEFTIKKNSPEILLGAGIVGFVGTVVLACRATCRADEVLEFHRKKIKDINDAKEIADADPEGEMSYDVEIYRQDKAIRYLKTTGNLAKLYAPTIAIGTLSLACILTSRNIMQKRYLGVVAAYNGLSAAFEEYRKRVRDEYGEGLDKHFRYGTTYEELPVYDENGKKTKEKEQVEKTETGMVMQTDDSCRFFDSSNPNWDKNPTFSMMWLRGQQNILNDILHTRGHVFLNEVYDALGFPHTPQGAVLGWIDGEGDDCIDFGLYDQNKESVRRFVNGVDNVIMLEFNHDGVIWDKI